MQGMKIKELMNDKSARVYVCSRDFIRFCFYYFPLAFTYPVSESHKKYMRSLQEGDNVFVEGMREFGKSTILKYFYMWCIVYKKKRYIMHFAYEKSRASAMVFDVSVQLQTNERIIQDFGHLHHADMTRNKSQSQRKRVDDLITENEVRIKAFGIGMSPRGELYGASDGEYRPDLIGMDDIDVEKSVVNEAIIDKTYHFLRSEVFGAISTKAQRVFLGNTILEDGIVPRIRRDYIDRKQYIVPLYIDGILARPQKYSEKKQEGKVWVEELKKDGQVAFNKNYMLIPYRFTSLVKRGSIQYHMGLEEYDRLILGVDPAVSLKQHSDGFALVLVGHKGDDRFVLEAVNLKGEEKKQQNAKKEIARIYDEWGVTNINYEDVQAQRRLGENLQRDGYAVTFVKVNKDKLNRFKEKVEWKLNNGHVWFTKGTERLVDQLLSFPNGKYDDGVDAMGLAFDDGDYVDESVLLMNI